MAISGGIKYFNQSQCLSKDGASIVSSSGLGSAEYCLDRNSDTYWLSVGSDDLTTETLTITFPESVPITRILILDHNFKDYNIMYDVAGTWTHFSSVVGLDGSLANITETAFADTTAYYEFASVTTQSIRIEILKTQVANDQKYCSQVIATTEIGTFVGFPEVREVSSDRNARISQTSSGRYIVQKSTETFGTSINFKSYPRSSTYSVDIDLVMTLQDREEPFLVWLCGGRRGSTYFGYTLRGFRLEDCLLMQITKELKLSYTGGVYVNGLNTSLVLEEHI